jgi:hypothetical protein
MSNQVLHCTICHRRFREHSTDAAYWNCEVHSGVVTRIICPDCQTPTQDMEAAVNDAMLDYSSRDGLLVGRSKETVK